MEDITNYPKNTSQLGVKKEFLTQKMDEEVSPNDALNSTTMKVGTSQNDSSQGRKQALFQLVRSYLDFANDSSDINLDMDTVLNRLIEATRSLKPPAE